MTTMNMDTDFIPPAPRLTRQNAQVMGRRICVTCPTVLDPEKPDFIMQCDDCFKDESTKRNCSQCNLPRIINTEPEWKVVCTTCYKDSARRDCAGCHLPKIPIFEPTWRNLCGECFNDKSKYRICKLCGEKAIRPGVPKYLSKCGDCWRDERTNNFEQCPICLSSDPKEFKRKTAPCCRSCMKSKGLVKTNKAEGIVEANLFVRAAGLVK